MQIVKSPEGPRSRLESQRDPLPDREGLMDLMKKIPSPGHWIVDLVGGWTNPLEKYDRQIGSCPQGSGGKLKKYLSCHHPVDTINPFLRHTNGSLGQIKCSPNRFSWRKDLAPGNRLATHRKKLFKSCQVPWWLHTMLTNHWRVWSHVTPINIRKVQIWNSESSPCKIGKMSSKQSHLKHE